MKKSQKAQGHFSFVFLMLGSVVVVVLGALVFMGFDRGYFSASIIGTNISTSGNLIVGDGTPDVTQNGEDAYVEGTLEVDGNVRFDGDVSLGTASELLFGSNSGGSITTGAVWWNGTNFLGYTGSAQVQLDNVAGGGAVSLSSVFDAIGYGDGSSGELSTSEDLTLTGDLMVTNLTVNSGHTLETGGFRIFATGTVTIANGGVIDNDGDDGSSSSWGGTSALANVSCGTSGSGGSSVSVGNPGGSVTGLGGNGGSGGNDGGGIVGGGLGGTVTASSIPTAISLYFPCLGVLASNASNYAGGGGGGGGGYQSMGGPGGGSGGGVVVIVAKTAIVNAGTLSAHGGDGGNGVAGNAGGGGGGGGGVIYLVAPSITVGTTDVSGGGGGSSFGTGGAGSAGSSGRVVQINP